LTADPGDTSLARCLEYECPSAAATGEVARELGRLAPAGLVIALTGELGSGKTTFIQALARGLEVPADCYVTSPSFTLVNEYPGRVPLCHADLYRLGEGADLEGIGLLERMNGEAVVAIEWAGYAGAELPRQHLTVHLEIVGKGKRRVTLCAYGLEVVNLLKQLADCAQCSGPIGVFAP
jgi:tRNA threonylcarbamoyladenosine biosynthesis protein TsaE